MTSCGAFTAACLPFNPADMFRNAYILLILTMLCWAGNSIAGKIAVGHVSPMLLNTMRWLVAALVLGILYREMIRTEAPALKKNGLLLLFLGTLGFTGFSIALYTALLHTSAINVSIEQAAMPLVVFLFNFMLFRTGVSAAQIMGFLLSAIGVLLIISHGEPARLIAMDFNIGDLIMLGAVVCYGVYIVALRLKTALGWQTFLFALILAGFISSLPFTIWEFAVGNSILPTATGWGVIAYTAIFPSLISQALFIRGVELIGANRAGLFINLVPIFATLMSIAILGEEFHAYHALALILVLGGIGLAERSGRKRAAGLKPHRPS